MNPELTGFALGLLLGAAKIAAIGTVGFGIAWWRARARIKQLEAERLQVSPDQDRIARVEQNVELVVDQLDRLVRSHAELNNRLGPGTEVRALPPLVREPPTGKAPDDGVTRS